MPKNKIVLTPFEKAKINVQKTAENFNLYNSMVMLSEALESIDQLDDQDRRDMELMFASVIQQMATHLEGSGDEWN
tara:strand:+ start:603 stop:830 length:228 start_codon:yes stop_codon:yes gene_type:complete